MDLDGVDTPSSIIFHNPNIRIGFHISKERSITKSFSNLINAPLRSYQLYISNGRAYQPPKADPDDLREACRFLHRNGKYACVHGCLLYNLAGMTDGPSNANYKRNLNNTVNGLMTELDVAAGFDSGVVAHIGSRKDRKKGILTISQTIEDVLSGENSNTRFLSKGLSVPVDDLRRKRKIILENAAGEGNKIGSTLDEIAQIIDGVDEVYRPQVKVCIDTAHIFGAGQYDMGSPKSVVKFFKDFDKKIGLDRLEVFHLNDSRVPYGSKKDRHENLGIGYIFGLERGEDVSGDGLEGLKKLIEKAEELRVPLVGEPPAKTKEGVPAPGGIWDYEVIKHLCNLEEEFVCE
jgi:apurinic endonuclease APN1